MKRDREYYKKKRARAELERATSNIFGGAFEGCGVSDCITYNGKPSKHLDFAIDFKRQTLTEYRQTARPIYIRG